MKLLKFIEIYILKYAPKCETKGKAGERVRFGVKMIKVGYMHV